MCGIVPTDHPNMTLPANLTAAAASPSLPLAVMQAVAVQPVPQAMEQAGAAQPGHFQAALDHVPVQSPLAQLEAAVVPAGPGVQEQEPQEAQGPVVFHTSPRKAEGKAQESSPLAQPAKVEPPASQAMTPQARGTASTTTRSSSSGCCDTMTGCCDDSGTTYIVVQDDGSCAAAINCCATGVLRTCQALARLPGAVVDCLPSSQAIHTGCDRLVSGAAWCCEGFGDCLVAGLGLCKDIICCPCTTCGHLCDACCKGLEDPSCCSSDVVCCCCCSDCDCSGCDCDC